MKKLFKTLAVTLVLCLAFAFAGCGVNQDAADKINAAAKNGEPITYEQLVKDYGEPTYKIGIDLGDLGQNGTYVWVNGCDTKGEVQDKWDNEEPVEALTVVIVGGKATGATYSENYTE